VEVLGGIYSPNHYSSCWLCSLSTDTPDSPVRTGHCIVHCLVHATSVDRWGLEQLTLNLSVLVAHRTVRCDLTLHTVSDLLTLQTVVAVDRWRRRPLLVGSPDSPVNFSRGVLHFPESGQFAWRASLGIGHCPVRRRLVQIYFVPYL
jgi:hypothetical protein